MTSSRSGPRLNRRARPAGAAAARASAAEAPRLSRLRPALFAGYRDLSALRYDYPLVLVESADKQPALQSLGDIVDRVLRQISTPGNDGERLRVNVLKQEQQIRARVAADVHGTLSELWRQAAEALLAGTSATLRPALAEDLEQARRALGVDGRLLGCGIDTPASFVQHLWLSAEQARRRRFAERIKRLILRLRALLRTDFLESAEARSAERLQRAFGTQSAQIFDFQAMSRILEGATRPTTLPERRRRRINGALQVLETQRFAPAPVSSVAVEPHDFYFESCRTAMTAFHARQPEMAALVKAMGIAELELENRYRDAVHDPFFQRFDINCLTPSDLDWFPTYLVVLRDASLALERSAVLDTLTAGLPVKMLLQFDDVLENLPLASGKLAFGRKRPQFAGMALGLNSAFVLQATSSLLYRMRERIQRGLSVEGPALFCVYSGCGEATAGLPPYLLAAAAVESRSFPAFTYDPSAGHDWASRFDVRDNPQPEADWPVHRLDYEGSEHQRLQESVAFTFADFAACDLRYAEGLQRLPGGRAGTVGVAEFLRQTPPGNEKPSLLLVDEDDRLYRFAAGEELIEATRRCAEAWHSLQELGGINNSHAQRLLLAQRALWDSERQAEQAAAAAPAPQAGAVAAPAAAASAPAATAAAAPEPASDEPYIETPRCSTCEECVQVNNRMFAYDDNKQAYIKDATAGSYRELVEAAENCTMAIIHPGKPRNPAEPGLEDLLKRALPFQ